MDTDKESYWNYIVRIYRDLTSHSYIGNYIGTNCIFGVCEFDPYACTFADSLWKEYCKLAKVDPSYKNPHSKRLSNPLPVILVPLREPVFYCDYQERERLAKVSQRLSPFMTSLETLRQDQVKEHKKAELSLTFHQSGV